MFECSGINDCGSGIIYWDKKIMKLANILAFIVVAVLAAAGGYFVGTDMKGLPGQQTEATAAAQAIDPSDSVVATVDGIKIRESYVKRMYESLPAQYKQTPYAFIKAQLVDQLVNMRLVQNAAKAEKYDSQSEFVARVEDVQLQLLQEYYLQEKMDEAVTDEALIAEYNKVTAEFKAEQEAHARHILLKEEQQAKDVIVLLDAGGDFTELAKEHSTGPSGPQGGDLGYFVAYGFAPLSRDCLDVNVWVCASCIDNGFHAY